MNILNQSDSKPLQTQSGFSLIEIIVSLFIIGCLIFLFGGLPQSIQVVSGSRNLALARDILNSKIEDLRAKTYGNLANTTEYLVDPRLNSLPFSYGQVVIKDCPVTIRASAEAAKKITVTITWKEDIGIKDAKTTTIISQGGL